MIVPSNGQNKKLARFFNEGDIFFSAQEISVFMKILLAVQKACSCTLSVMLYRYL